MNAPPYNSQNPYPYQGRETSGWAIFSLISGILGWLGLFGLGGIAAVISGHIAKGQIRSSAGRVGGDGLATAGLVMGYLNIAGAVVGLCFFLLVALGLVATPAVCGILSIPFMNSY
jgi:hypothetical protein